jgi:hypothetical protein
MQQMLIQQMFQAADANGDGMVSKTEFENFYNHFMGANASPGAPSSTAAADQLFQQLNATGNGLTQSQFASAVKIMMSQKAQGQAQNRAAGLGGAASGAAATSNGISTASAGSTTWLEKLLASNQNAAAQTGGAQSSGSLEFIA